ncbi:MAG: hypothetical protein NTX53_11010 [candidate division WOR-3 bacterium]|nr:hypothetical protein [candidate division WOR-3 bacterium]
MQVTPPWQLRAVVSAPGFDLAPKWGFQQPHADRIPHAAGAFPVTNHDEPHSIRLTTAEVRDP